jgi:formiminotetrahydrofolate cyclodeaminase
MARLKPISIISDAAEVIIAAIATTPKSSGESKRARTIMLTNRSTSPNTWAVPTQVAACNVDLVKEALILTNATLPNRLGMILT